MTPEGRGVWFMLPVESGYTGVTFCCGRRIAKRTEETTGALHKSYFQDRDGVTS